MQVSYREAGSSRKMCAPASCNQVTTHWLLTHSTGEPSRWGVQSRDVRHAGPAGAAGGLAELHWDAASWHLERHFEPSLSDTHFPLAVRLTSGGHLAVQLVNLLLHCLPCTVICADAGIKAGSSSTASANTA